MPKRKGPASPELADSESDGEADSPHDSEADSSPYSPTKGQTTPGQHQKCPHKYRFKVARGMCFSCYSTHSALIRTGNDADKVLFSFYTKKRGGGGGKAK